MKQETALKIMQDGYNVFLTGSAGTRQKLYYQRIP